jgi:deazaflavin-dependent oxidoreductase (nitroreductase family)
LHDHKDPQNAAAIRRYNDYRIEQIRTLPGHPVSAFAELPEVGHLVLTTTGAKSGVPRSVPLGYIRDGDTVIIDASVDGRTTHPDWYHNLVQEPHVTIETLGNRLEAVASTVTGDERARLWELCLAHRPIFAELQAKTTRQIPIVRLEMVKVKDDVAAAVRDPRQS